MTKSTVSSGGGISGTFTRFWNFLKVATIATKWIIIETFTKHRKVNLEAIPKKTGETAVITGGARGIGPKVVEQLLKLDMNVIIACRNPSAGIQLIDQLRQQGIQSGNAEALSLDLNSLSSVRAFSQTLLDRQVPISILINNAGVMFSTYQVTNDGFESQLQTNYLGHFLLTNLLLPLLKSGGSEYRCSRVVNVTSCAHFGGDIDFDDLNMHKMYCKYMAYMASKLMQVAFSKFLNTRLKAEASPVQVYSVHPGVVNTDLYQNMWIIYTFRWLVKPFFRTVEQGADGIVYVAVSPDVETDGGEYFMNCQRRDPNPRARDPAIQQKLWTTSQTLVGLKSVLEKDAVEIVMKA